MSQHKEPPEKHDEKEPIKVSFSLPQLIGGALAAATAAAIGSTLGVAGTIMGAAVASIIGGVGGTLYSAGIDRTHRKVASVITRTGKTAVHPAEGVDITLVDVTGVTSELPPLESGNVAPSGRPKRLWKVAAITAAAIFAISLVVVTVVELGLGRAFGGGDGTTVSQVVRPDRQATRSPSPTPTPSPTATSPSPTVSETPTPTPSEPTATLTPSVAPTPATATETPATIAPAEATATG